MSCVVNRLGNAVIDWKPLHCFICSFVGSYCIASWNHFYQQSNVDLFRRLLRVYDWKAEFLKTFYFIYSVKNEQYKLLVTRASIYHIRKQELSTIVSSTTKMKSNYLSKFISCCKHTGIVNECQECLIFPAQK